MGLNVSHILAGPGLGASPRLPEEESVRATDPEGELLRSLVEEVIDSNGCGSDPERFDLIAPLMDMDSALERDWLKNRFLVGLWQGQIHGCRELVKRMEKGKRGSIRAIDPEEEIFRDLIVQISSFCDRQLTGGLTLAEELLDLGFDLEAGALRDALLKEVILGKRFVCQELIRLFREKRGSEWEACDPEQKIANAVLDRIFDNFPTGNPEWGLLLVDLGFEPSWSFLEKFFVMILSSYSPISNCKEMCEYFFRAHTQPLAESDPEGTLISMVVMTMYLQAGVDTVYSPRREKLCRVEQYQFHLGLLNSLIDAGALIPNGIGGVSLFDLLGSRASLQEARDTVAFALGRRTTKSARRRP